jgi:hypothetical protein
MNGHLKLYLKQTPVLNRLVPVWRKAHDKVRAQNQRLEGFLQKTHYRRNGFTVISKNELIRELKLAIQRKTGYATGKIGKTAQYMVNYESVIEKERDKAKIMRFERLLKFTCLNQQGIFPADNEFCRLYSKFYIDHIKNLDCLGICYYPGELEILQYYELKNKLIYFVDQEPGKYQDNCYLPYFREKKILIVCPFAGLLKQRATKEIFERVWSKTGKKWFYPASVDALEFPYGFSPETHRKYPTVIDLFEKIKEQLNKRDFDIALIGAAGLAIPIASTIKDMGKIAIDLGGHLQIVFGVIGQRWRNLDDMKRNYFTEHWIDMPERYRPKEANDVCDRGAYW